MGDPLADPFAITFLKGRMRYGHQPVVAKVLRSRSLEQKTKLLQDIANLARMPQCDRVTTCYGGCVARRNGDVVWQVWEFMDLGSLDDMQQRRGHTGVPQSMLAGIIRQLLEGLSFLHGCELVFKSVSLEKSLHNTQGQVKLTDVGNLAGGLRTIDELMSKTFVEIGRCSMSPERCMGEKYGAKDDIWGLGCVVYELATGTHPFSLVNCPDFLAQYEAICDRPEPRLDCGCFDEPLCVFCGACLTREVADRPEAADLLLGGMVYSLLTEDAVPPPGRLATWFPRTT